MKDVRKNQYKSYLVCGLYKVWSQLKRAIFHHFPDRSRQFILIPASPPLSSDPPSANPLKPDFPILPTSSFHSSSRGSQRIEASCCCRYKEAATASHLHQLRQHYKNQSAKNYENVTKFKGTFHQGKNTSLQEKIEPSLKSSALSTLS